jgi:hypothetical protein
VIRELTLADALYVVRHMRQRDRDGFRAALGEQSDDELAVGRFQAYGPAWALDVDGVPAAIGGLHLVNGWTAVMWLVVSEGVAPESWRKLMRHTRTVIANALDSANEHGRRRIEAYVMGNWPEAQKLVQRLGFSHEGTRRGAGSGGEDLQMWALLQEQQ